MASLKREVEVSRYLAARDVGVTRPIGGPFVRERYVISFWEAETVTAAPDPVEAGRRLRACHSALAAYDGERPLWGGFTEARAVLERARGNGMMAPDRARDGGPRVVVGRTDRRRRPCTLGELSSRAR